MFRLKYAFVQINLDDWMTRGSWARFGIQQTPFLDYAEGIYRYRFQGTTFAEREGYFTSADAGASFHYNLPSNYGDVHVGIYNGEDYAKAEPNDQKAIKIRGTLRPFAAMAPGSARPADHRLLLRRQLHQERRENARDRSGHVRAQVHQRRLRVR